MIFDKDWWGSFFGLHGIMLFMGFVLVDEVGMPPLHWAFVGVLAIGVALFMSQHLLAMLNRPKDLFGAALVGLASFGVFWLLGWFDEGFADRIRHPQRWACLAALIGIVYQAFFMKGVEGKPLWERLSGKS